MAITDLIPWKKPENRLALSQPAIDPLAALRQEIDQVFNNIMPVRLGLGDWTARNLSRSGMPIFMPTIDVKETAKEIRVTAELPGLEEKDIQVSLLDGMLTIKGEKREEHEEEKGEIYRCERQYGSFERTIGLPAEVDTDKVQASFKKGVLKVMLPKTKEAQTNRRMIPVQS